MAVMEHGKIVEQGSVVNLFTSPKNDLTRSFIQTIVNHNIPRSILKRLDQRYPIYRLTFLGENSEQDLLSRINKEYKVSTRILSASVNEVGETVLGILFLQIEGEENLLKDVENYIRKNQVSIERVVYGEGLATNQ